MCEGRQMSDERRYFRNGRATSPDALHVSAFGPLALWGEGSFDTFRVSSGRILFVQQHQDRLLNAARSLWGVREDIEDGLHAAWEFLEEQAKDYAHGRGRVLVAPQDALRKKFDVFAELLPFTPMSSAQYQHGVRVGFSELTHPGYGRWGKSTSALWSRMAAEEARNRGLDEVILCRGEIVVESAWSALMWREEDVWRTPAASLAPLPSTTLAALRQSGLEVEEVVSTRERLSYADAIVLLSAVRLAIGVERLEDRVFDAPDDAAAPLRDILLRA